VKDLLITRSKVKILQEFITQTITFDNRLFESLRGAKKSDLVGETQITL
jgi:hypothetical protein